MGRVVKSFLVAGALVFVIGLGFVLFQPGIEPESRDDGAERVGVEVEVSKSGTAVGDPAVSEDASSASAELSDLATSEVEPEDLGPVSIHGKVSDGEGKPVSAARLVAINSTEWSAILTGAQEDSTEAQEDSRATSSPKKMLDALKERYVERMSSLARSETDEEGAYAFHRLPEGDYRLMVSHVDFLPEKDVWAVVSPEAPARCDVTLVEAYRLSGRVVDPKGQPISGARVKAIPTEQNARGIARFIGILGNLLEGNVLIDEPVETDASGAFEAPSLEPLIYDLKTTHEGHLPTQTRRVPAGATNIIVVMKRGATISGRLVDEEENPVANAEWSLGSVIDPGLMRNPMALMQGEVDIFGENDRDGKTDATGRFMTSGLGDGKYRVALSVEGYPELTREVDVAGADALLGDLALETPLYISGVVRDPDGQLVPEARVWIEDAVKVRLQQLMSGSEAKVAEAESDSAGRFRLGPLVDGAYEVKASASGFAVGVAPDALAGRRGLEITLERGVTVRGRVLDAVSREPIEDVKITAFMRGQKKTRTDADGLFVISGLSKNPRNAMGVTNNMVFLQFRHADYAMKHSQVPLMADDITDPTEVLLDIVEDVHGFVVDTEGEAVRGARIRVGIAGIPHAAMMFGGKVQPAVFSAADGSFSVPAPSGGGFGGGGQKMEVEVSHPNYATARVPRTEENVEMEIVLAPGVRIEGTVTDSDGAGVGGARLRLQAREKLDLQALIFRKMWPEPVGRVVYSSASGHYSFPAVDAGEYRLTVEAIGHAKEVVEPLHVGDLNLVRDVVLRSGGSIAGRVVDTEGQAVVGAEVLAFFESEDAAELEAELVAVTMLLSSGDARVRSTSDGTYRLKHLSEGSYTLAARAAGYYQAEIAGVETGTDAAELVLQRLATLDLRVTDAVSRQAISAYRLKLNRQKDVDEERDPFRHIPAVDVTDADGRHVRKNLRPGRYQITVNADGYSPSAEEVELIEAEEKAVDIALDVGYEVSVRIKNELGGYPIVDARIRASKKHDPERPWLTNSEIGASNSARSSEDGLALFKDLPAGEYEFRSTHPDFFIEDRRELPGFRIPEDAGAEFAIAMKPGGKVHGSLTGEVDLDVRHYEIILRELRSEKGEAEVIGGETANDDADASEDTASEREPEVYTQRVSRRSSEFTLDSLRPGQYQLLLTQRGRESGDAIGEPVPIREVEVVAGQTVSVTVSAP